MANYRELAGIVVKGGFFEDECKLKLYDNQKDRISIIYGKNGSGKSSIARGFEEYKSNINDIFSQKEIIDYNEKSIILSDEEKKNIYVFDENYIEKNIRINAAGLNTIVMFGKQVDLEEDIKKTEDNLVKYKKSLENQQIKCSEFEDESNICCPEYHIKLIMDILRRDGKWADIDSKIKGNIRKSQVKRELIDSIVKTKTSITLDKLKEEFELKSNLYTRILGSEEKYPNKIDNIVISPTLEREIIEVLSKIITKPKTTEREKLILETIQNGGQISIEKTAVLFSKEETKICPYCYQVVDEKYKKQLMEEIHRVLNKDVDNHKAEIDQIKICEISVDYDRYLKLDSNLIEVIKQGINECNQILASYNTYLEEKRGNVFNPINIKKLELDEKISFININLNQLEKIRQEYNNSVDNKISIKNDLIRLNTQMAWHDISALYMSYLNQNTEKKKANLKLKELSDEVNAITTNLNKLKQEKKNIKIALDNINRSLEYIFFSKERLSLEVKDDKYCLRSYGKNVKLKNISVGERNIIALCYFFSQVLDNCTQGQEFCKECLLIIDDPISSFDFENKIGIHSYLKNQIKKVLDGNKESRIAILTHELESAYDFLKTASEVVSKPDTYIAQVLNQKRLSLFSVRNRHEYSNLLELIFKFAKQESGYEEKELIIGNSIRRVLEAYSTFEYRMGIEDISCNPLILNKLGHAKRMEYFENLMYRLVLHGESHFQERVQSLPESNFYNFISLDEKVRTAKDVLAFLYALNPEHIAAHLKNIPGAFEDVKNWCNTIAEVS